MQQGAATKAGETTNSHCPLLLLPSTSMSSSSAMQRPYRCGTCPRAFRELATLRKHEQLHRADRPYVCHTCGKSFLWSSNLKVHERVHTGERPYKCKICHRCFTQSNDLRRHERNVHMPGKLLGFRHGVVPADPAVRGVAGAGSQHVNLVAYQAFAMQQRVLQRALTYEGYLHGDHSPVYPHHTHVANSMEASVTSGCEGMVVADKGEPKVSDLQTTIQVKMEPGIPTISSPGHREEQERGVEDKDKGLLMNSPCQGVEALQQQSSVGLHSSPTALGPSKDVLGHSPVSAGYSPFSMQQCNPAGLRHPLSSLQHSPDSSQKQHNSRVSPLLLPPSSICPAPLSLAVHLASPPMLLAVSDHGSPYHTRTPSPLHTPSAAFCQPTQAFNCFRPAPSCSSSEHHLGSGSMPALLSAVMCQDSNGEDRERRDRHLPRSTCDSIMDLSVNKGQEAHAACTSEYKPSEVHHQHHPLRMAPTLKSPESECHEKRHITTTLSKRHADGDIHHCPHCNIVFSDYTMFHLHDSLHLPYQDHPFRCPSCNKHCQDRIEFMFHTVWHVKYPHTIPNYVPFKENLVS